MVRRCALLAVAIVLIASCSSAGRGVTTVSVGAPAQVFTPPPFYDVPSPLPAGGPGAVIKTEDVSVPSLHGTMRRVMYHSQSISGADIAVTGLIAVPSSTPPAGGFPVITWAHGTTGIADMCAPSLGGAGAIDFANRLLDAGYVVTATDYEGLGTPGRHPYIVGESEARSTLDIVRAARNLADSHASDRYVVWGHSQGGHAAMFSLHIADAWAPELHLVGVVAGAPPSQLYLVYLALKDSPFRAYILMAAAGFNAAYGDTLAPLDKVLTPTGIQALQTVDDGCADYVAQQTAGIPTDDMIAADPGTVPEWNALLNANDPGKFTAPGSVPLLMIQGGNDEQIPVVSTQILFDQQCAIGQTEQRWVYPGQSHAGVIGPSFDDMLVWIANRFAGAPAPDPYQPVGQADIETESCPAAATSTPTPVATPEVTPTPAEGNALPRTG
jgi:pimeloyl-ACP methyl ester carboxylesterase